MTKTRIVLPIEGISCASSAATVQDARARANGVANAAVNYATAKAAVDYDDARTGVADLIKTVRAAGYECGQATVSFGVQQLHYAPSVVPLEQALLRVPGAIRAAANQATETRSEERRVGQRVDRGGSAASERNEGESRT